MSIIGSIVAGNSSTGTSADVLGPVTSLGHNLIGKTDGSSGWTGSDKTGTNASPLDPRLGPLGNYGGPTQTMALLPGSPAIGAGGAASGVTTDQRGAARGASPDIGAFQLLTPALNVLASASSTVYGQPLILSVSLATLGMGVPNGVITFTDNGSVLGTAAPDNAGIARLNLTTLLVGSHSINASLGASSGTSIASASQSKAVVITQASTQAVLVPLATFAKKNKVTALNLKAVISAIAPGGGTPTGNVIFEILGKKKKPPKVLGTVSLNGGKALLVGSPKKLLKQSIVVLYSGDANFKASTVTMTVSNGSLVRQ